MTEEENAPLLSSEGVESNLSRNRKRPNLFPTEPVRSNAVCADDRIFVNATVTTPSEVEPDLIVAIFVVAFDTRSGNMVEWCMPDDADLDGVEFKAMVSGSHTQTKDFVYFRKDSMYGLACFENMPVESEIERGARMKSVGILATSYTLLYRHLQFLETQVRHQLETPGKYTQLQAFYEDKTSALGSLPSSKTNTPNTPLKDFLPELKITHPAGCFTQFAKFFGEQIFLLWKYALLEKRILFFSPPPIGVVCYRVYCACCLANHDMRGMGRKVKPHFYVNVADIETLESEVTYIACTTEKIFETKTSLYDIYVDNQVVRTHQPGLKDLLKCSSADREKFQKLNNLRSAHQFSYEDLGEEAIDEEEIFVSFFQEQNNRLFQTLLDVANSQDTQLTSDHMKSMGLDPSGDRQFLMDLVEHYGIDVVLMVDNPCCPK
ncbi:DENN domain-containing protein 11-like [Mya arenaria]|uniref:DENN domain-containing protein 11-like n=1 Tax=Mya arenaria TaxID=6604 RepID=UPI0022E178F5|nr:DENN domain-containing protein 11-like [Mya arenaria]